MSQAVEANSMSADEYLAWEELQEEKHEYYHGEIFAMGGARREYVQVSLNIASALKPLLRGTPCRAYMSDMKLHVATMDTFFYPDVIVSCHKKDHQAEQYLSDSTEAYDRWCQVCCLPAVSKP
jgi:Uma2 family endonuclease